MISKNTPSLIMLVLLIIFFVVVPHFLKDKSSRPGASRNIIENLYEFNEANNISPEDLLFTLWNTNDIVFLGDPGKYHETSDFVKNLVPFLREKNIDSLGVSFLNYEDQDEIDTLIKGETFDYKKADRLLFNNLVMNGYEEYRNIIQAVWESNHDLKENQAPLRLIGLNVKQDWSVVQSSKDTDRAEIIQKIYALGVPDTYMAEVIKKEIIAPKQKALIFIGLQNCLSTVQAPSYEEKMREYNFPNDTKRTARLIKELSSVKSCTLFLHALWQVDNSSYGIDFPLGGALDSFMDKYPITEQRIGLLTKDTPFGKLPATPGSLGTAGDYDLSDFCDGYILLGSIRNYTPLKAIPNFINEENFSEALANFPGPKTVLPDTPEELNRYIAENGANVKKLVEKFSK
jgi:hypothetical protein